MGSARLKASLTSIVARLRGLAIGWLRALTMSRAAAAVRRVPAVRRVAAAVCEALAVRESGALFAREMRGSRQLARYTLAGFEGTVHLEHGSSDMEVLAEVFFHRYYDPPPVAAARLAGLGHAPRVLDLGMHIGLFELYARSQFGTTDASGFEPDPRNAATLRRTLAANDLSGIAVEQACASNRDGTTPFRAGHGWGSRIVDQSEIGAVEIATRDVFPLLPGVDLLKMDIEGGEWALLTDPRWSAIEVPVIVLEYHDLLCPFGDPRQACFDALAGAGYAVFPHPSALQSLVWAVKPSA